MVLKNWNSPRSLISMAIHSLVNNLAIYADNNFELLKPLPCHIKNRILKRFTTTSYFWRNIDFKLVLAAILNDHTYDVNLTSAVLDDEILDVLVNSTNIRNLYLSRMGSISVTTRGLINLFSKLRNLQFLVLTNCDKMTDEVLQSLSENSTNLSALDIGGCKGITDTGIKFLGKLKNLSWIALSRTQVSDEGISALVRESNGEKIKELRIDNCANVTDIGLKAIADNCPNIEVLIFYNCSPNRVRYGVLDKATVLSETCCS